ncbi:thioredoxin domain-containing protein [Candidatus Dojkabacteria bacterium]|uniref:Thioredoxin domain-containing protein n=1 Tax=Candidatus Dojkabacteria bacterium TaxID=2099670 RepID=A0A955L397_9BACT|nr:thioredoxin domain-containing protein [Candidatus Dojkabacteria bacterium]
MAEKKFNPVNIIPVFALVGVIVLIIWLLGTGGASGDPVNTEDWTTGVKASQIQVVEFSDFECPACAAAEPSVEKTMEKYKDVVGFTYKHFPLRTIHPEAAKLSEASEAAGAQGKFWEFKSVVFANHDVIFADGENDPIGKMEEIVKANVTGLDFDKFKSELDSGMYKPDVAADELEAKQLNLTYTPSFMLNGELLDLQSFSDLDSAIEAKLKDLGIEVPTADTNQGTQPATN